MTDLRPCRACDSVAVLSGSDFLPVRCRRLSCDVHGPRNDPTGAKWNAMCDGISAKRDSVRVPDRLFHRVKSWIESINYAAPEILAEKVRRDPQLLDDLRACVHLPATAQDHTIPVEGVVVGDMIPLVAAEPPQPTCCKCGGGETAVRWTPAPEDRSHTDRRPEPVSEYLRHTCKRCGYDWSGPVADAGDKAEEVDSR